MQYNNNLEYQNEVTNILGEIFNIPDLFFEPPYSISNPLLNLSDTNKSILYNNIKKYNNKLSSGLWKEPYIDDYLNLDIKMETGTGKTYVYTKTIFELNKRYGINKFIILVPSIAIKLGTQNFINDSLSHFHQEYGKFIDLNVQSSNNNQNAKNKMPSQVKNFVKISMPTNDFINVLLLNDDYFNNTKYGKLREWAFLDDFTTPADVIRATHPFLIIDEPHRFKDNSSVMTFIQERIKPQCIIRFGATFPENNGVKDYKNLVYDLNSRKAINDGLVKGVNVYIEGKRDVENIDFIVKNLKQGEQATFKYKTNNSSVYIEKEVKKGRVVSFLGDNFTGIKLKDITKDEVILSNGLVLAKGKLNNDIEKENNHYNYYDFSNETQEAIIRLALEKHFETEKKNFKRDDIIKTICLFFIEDIGSYRDRGKEQWIRNTFENLLTEKLDDELAKINENDEKELLYKQYLQATKENLKTNEKLKLVHGGYFAEDTDKSEGSEFKQILVNKEKTLNIYNFDGSFNTFRFIFSKWTLKEGWDNPNVFTIAKLRGSGSENSKLQEVGRGLRLPVDINMNRKNIGDEDFFLSYIVNNNERDFALKLISEVCPDGITKINDKQYLSKEQIHSVAGKLDKTYEELFLELLTSKIISADVVNDCFKIIDPEKFMEIYGQYLSDDPVSRKINQGAPKISGKTKIRKSNFAKIKELWDILNQNFIITYKNNAFDDESMKNVVYESLNEINNNKVLEKDIISFNSIETKQIILSEEHKINDEDYKHKNISVNSYNVMKYNDFLHNIFISTNIPISIIHEAIYKFINEKYNDKDYNIIFRQSINKILINTIISKKHSMIKGLFEYQSVNSYKKSTALTDNNGNVLESVSSMNLGKLDYKGKATINGNYLYDNIQYDSQLELENINADYGDTVEVYGKIPKNSIRIPKIDGCSCSPDFMYVLKDKTGNAKKMNLVVESKLYDSFDEDARGTEKYTKEYMIEYFKSLEETIKEKNIDVKFKYQLARDKVMSIIEDILEQE